MTISRNIFFIALLLLSAGPFAVYKLYWLARSTRAEGVMCFTGHSWDGNWIISHPVIKFEVSGKTIYFNNNVELDLKHGSPVPVRYRQDDPKDAKVVTLAGIWGDTFVYALFPLLLCFVLFVIPDRFDPVIPKKSRIRIGLKPFIKIIPN